MADNTYLIDTLALDGDTIILSDDGSGNDWLELDGTYAATSTITLSWTSSSGTATSASGIYDDGTDISQLIVNGSIENVRGSDGKDDITGNEKANVLYGDQASSGSGGTDTLAGGAGHDTVYGGAGRDLILGEDGSDLLYGDAGIDTIEGGAGIDTIEGGGGADVLSGGGEIGDTLSYLASASGVTVNITHGVTTTVTGGDGEGDSISGFSDVRGSASADVITDTNSTTLASRQNDNMFLGEGGNDLLVLGGGADTGYGGAGDDTLDGGAGDDLMDGGEGSDTYLVDAAGDVTSDSGSSGTDQVLASVSWTLDASIENLTLTGTATSGTGNALNNMISGSGSANTLSGANGNDTIYGGGGDDQLSGGSGDDSLDGGSGNDTADGGDGSDTYYVDATGDVTGDSGASGTDQVLASVNWTLASSIENLTLTGTAATGAGNSLNNMISGNSSANTLTGANGNDTIYGGSANDSLSGGSGDDSLDGGSGNDTLTGGDGSDLFILDSAGDVVNDGGASGIDTVKTGLTYTLGSTIENLILTGSSTSAGTGNALDNVLTGNDASNVLDGQAGNDTVYGGYGNDSLLGAGDDDVLYGGSDNDTLNGGAGADTLDGGEGSDTYVLDDAADVVSDSGTSGTDSVLSSLDWTLGNTLENLTLTGTATTGTGNALNNVLTGNDLSNTLTGGNGNDSLFGGTAADSLVGGAGDDSLDGGTGDDTMNGGDGSDVFVVDALTDVIIDNGASGTDTVQSSLTWTLATTLENLTLTGSAVINGTGNASANVVIGNDAANVLTLLDGNDTAYGGAGNDKLIGAAGNDYLDGGSGKDTLEGGAGADTYVVDQTTDVITEASGNTDIDSVISSVNWTLGGTLENLTLTGTGVINGTGNSLANIITGNDQKNNLAGNSGNDALYGAGGGDSLNGGAGDDTLDGGTGNDTMYGGNGSDSYLVDATADVITESGTSGTDTVISSVTWTLGSTLENLTLSGSGAINGTGNAGNNVMTGNGSANALAGLGGNDTVNGGSGNDTITGGAGADSLTGASGTDYFVFTATSDSTAAAQDVISDFSHAQGDKIDLSGIDAKSDGTSNDAFTFIAGAFTGQTGQLRIEATSGGFLVQGDTNGDSTADLVIYVAGATAPVVGDFLL